MVPFDWIKPHQIEHTKYSFLKKNQDPCIAHWEILQL